jgi:predicted ATP-binding protein involved in virulence
MKITHLRLENFRKFKTLELDLDPNFTLLVGENGSGKTSILDALAIAASIWFTDGYPDGALNASRNLKNTSTATDIRTEYIKERKEIAIKAEHTLVHAQGFIGENPEEIKWGRKIRKTGKRTSNDRDAKKVLEEIRRIYQNEEKPEPAKHILCPVLAYYGAHRSGIPSNERKQTNHSAPNRWSAFYDCMNERIRIPDIQQWFIAEAIKRGDNKGEWSPDFEVVRKAIINCVPHADDIYYHEKLGILLTINGNMQPFFNLSLGQRMMLLTVADIATKCMKQNFWLPPESVLKTTPGLVLIDELDVHLHPAWQRIVARNLKETFPQIQFVCTTHSPQVIGELPPQEIRILQENGEVKIPPVAYGADSNQILESVMSAENRNKTVAKKISDIQLMLDDETDNLDGAKEKLEALRKEVGDSNNSVVALQTTIANMEILANADY